MTRVIIITGPPGAGKSTLARTLAHNLGAVLLSKDSLSPLVNAIVSNDRAGATYTEHVRPAEYSALWTVVADQTAVPVVVVDAPALWIYAQFGWDAVRKRLAPADVELWWADTPPEVMFQRVQRRGLARDADKTSLEFWTDMPLEQWRQQADVRVGDMLPVLARGDFLPVKTTLK